ncbi:MAG TPA: carbohydrate ABC transporter permease [Acetobacteraceae bacterium]|nr:carbohydrate ABC transporter permease [Acetobacteraceae bacterium]
MKRRSLLCWLVLAPLIVVNLFPFAVMLATAVKPASEVVSAAPSWLPSRFAWGNFIAMWHAANFGTALMNSVYVSVASAAVAILISIPAAYATSRYRFRLKGIYRDFLLITQMLSPIVLVLGLFRLAAWLGLLNSLNALVIIYAAFQIAFAVWMMQSYFSSIPIDLEEAAWLEGASRVRAVWSIFLPMSVPAIAVTAIFTFINAWNEFAVALTLLRSENQYTLPIQIFSLVAGRYTVQWEQVMAATFLATVPVAIVFGWLQRYLVRGLALGAVK